MKERPILFSAPMVLAILAGRKTQTRRVVKHPHARDIDAWAFDSAKGLWRVGIIEAGATADMGGISCPYGVPGDQLWVRETWRTWEDHCEGEHRLYCEAEDHEVEERDCDEHCHQTYVAYAATPRKGYRPKPDGARITFLDESSPLENDSRLSGPWKPSIFMPRWASRLSLEVTGVRVERLKQICETEAIAEGAEYHDGMGTGHSGYRHDREHGFVYATARESFAGLWESINGAGSWAANPWVWCLEFRRAP